MHTIYFKTINNFSYGACKYASRCLFIPVVLSVLQNVLIKLVTRGQTAHADLVNTTITSCLFKKSPTVY